MEFFPRIRNGLFVIVRSHALILLTCLAVLGPEGCPPDVTLCTPDRVSAAGGDEVLLTGTNFGHGTDVVTFDGVRCTVKASSSTELTVVAPGGDVGPVTVQVCNDMGCSEPREDLLSYYQPDVVPWYDLEGQVYPEDFYWGYHVKGANLDDDPRTADLIGVADGSWIQLVWNDTVAAGNWQFTTWYGGALESSKIEGGIKDIAFLDLDGDGRDDHLFAAVGYKDDPTLGDDRLFAIDTAQRTLVGYEDLLHDDHLSMVALASRPGRLGIDGDWVVLGGGNYDNKQEMSTLRADTLRMVRIDGSTSPPAVTEVPQENLPMPAAVMADVDWIDANHDGKDDLLIAVWQYASGHDQSELLLNVTEPGDAVPRFVRAEGVLDVSAGASFAGVVVGDFNGDGWDDFALLGPSAIFFLNGAQSGTVSFVQHTESEVVAWADGFSFQKSYNAQAIDHDGDGRTDVLAVAAGTPYLLVNRTSSGEPPDGDIQFVDYRAELDPESSYLGGPLNTIYSTMDLLAADIDGDGHEDFVLADQNEQNRLWRCRYVDGGVESVEDVTETYLPAGGEMSTRFLQGDIDQDGDIDVLAINKDYPPDIYLNEAGGFIDGHDKLDFFPHPSVVDPSSGLPVRAGGWDGELADLNADGWLDLVVAGGGWSGAAKPNILYLWNPAAGRLEYQPWALPYHPDGSFDFNTRDAAAGDLDGDGDIDLVFANEDHYSQVALNDGAGVFPEADVVELPDLGGASHAVALAGDGRYPDLLLGGGFFGPFIDLFRNPRDGTANFTLETTMTLESGTIVKRLVPIDLDGDGVRDDFVVAVIDGANVLLNHTEDGAYTLQYGRLGSTVTETYSVGVGDLNDDGYDDIIEANKPDHGFWKDRVFLARGASDPGAFDEYTESVFEGYFNKEGSYDAALIRLDSTLPPFILIANDGQNRLLTPHLPDSH